MRCIIFAYSQLGHDCLKYIIEDSQYQVVAVITHEDNPDEHIWFDSVKKLSADNGIDVFTPTTLKDLNIQNILRSYKADAIFSFYYRLIIPEAILNIFPYGAYNMHGSLLPKYRGRCPVNWAIIHGEPKTGVTLHHMVKLADAGDIVDQEETPIAIDDTAGTVMDRMNKLAVAVLKRSLPLIAERTAPRIVQDATKASYFGGRSAKDGEINWADSARNIHNLIRALQPSPQYPAAFGLINNVTHNIISSHQRVNDTEKTYKPGTLINITNDKKYTIACGKNGDEILEITAT